jgi:hypothetical protein
MGYKQMIKDDPLNLKTAIALFLFALALPIIVTGMVTLLIKDAWLRQKQKTTETHDY